MQTVRRSRNMGSKACSMSWPNSRRHSNPQCWMRTEMCRVPAWRKQMKIEKGSDEYPLVQLFVKYRLKIWSWFCWMFTKISHQNWSPSSSFLHQKGFKIWCPSYLTFPKKPHQNWSLFRMIYFDTITEEVSKTILSHPNIVLHQLFARSLPSILSSIDKWDIAQHIALVGASAKGSPGTCRQLQRRSCDQQHLLQAIHQGRRLQSLIAPLNVILQVGDVQSSHRMRQVLQLLCHQSAKRIWLPIKNNEHHSWKESCGSNKNSGYENHFTRRVWHKDMETVYSYILNIIHFVYYIYIYIIYL